MVTKIADPTTVDILTPPCNLAASPRTSSYFASAVPISPGQSGNRFLTTDTPSTIYVNTAEPVPNPVPAATPTIQ